MIHIPAEKRWLLWLVLAAVFLALFSLFQSVLTPFILGAVIAYILNPLVERLAAFKFIPRWLGVSIAMLVFFGVFFASIAVAVPMIYREATDLLQSAPDWLDHVKELAAPYLEQLKPLTEKAQQNQEPMLDNLPSLGREVGGLAARALSFLMAQAGALMGVISLIALMPIVTFYLLYDWNKIIAMGERLIPREEAPTIRRLIADMNDRLGGFFRGQLAVCLVLSVVYVIALLIVGLNYAVVIGLLAGMLSFIPFIGSLVGLVASVSVAWFQFQSISWVAVVLAIFMAGQALEGNFLTPKLVGDKVGLHPLWVIFALMAGGSLFGFTGMLVALPVAAVIGVLVRFLFAQYTGSAAYQHERDKNPKRRKDDDKTATIDV